jgi:3-methyl-2-oxobutanoate hydroxymethyltransferase
MKKVTLHTLLTLKLEGKRFSCLTAYDASFAELVSSCGVEVILVGDSLGMVLQGHDSTLPVSIEEMAYHTACVKRGNRGSMIMADMPFMSYATPEQALACAAELMQAGAHIVKLEGSAWLEETIRQLSEKGIPVCAHLGLTPQAVNKLGGFKVQGRDPEQAAAMIEDARLLETAGASILLLECVPSTLTKAITEAVSVPVIGIGAGPDADAQVLVLHDMLGITCGNRPKFVKNFMTEAADISSAIKAFHSDVKEGRFPTAEHGFD